jgi:cytochrome c
MEAGGMRLWRTASAAIVAFSAAAPVLAQNAATGERVFNQQCRSCHTVDKGAANGIGPNLAGLFGRKAGTAEGFKASEAMKASGLVWDDTSLADYLRDPAKRVPGSTMVFAGLKQPSQLADVIAWLHKVAP